MDVARMIIEELRGRGVAFVNRFAPPYIASIGAHLLNLSNRDDPRLFHMGGLLDTRLHILIIAPPGFGKTLFIESFLRGPTAILYDSGVPVTWEQNMTEAGFVGTVKMTQTGPVTIDGVAKRWASAIIGMEEFHVLRLAMENEHSKTLDAQVLTALDTGYVKKSLGSGVIEYRTALTLWAGSQPMRVDLSSGLARRFVFIVWVPSPEERDAVKAARRRGFGRRPNKTLLAGIRRQIRVLKDRVSVVREVEIPETFYRWSDERRIPHYEEILYERLMLGWEIMKTGPRPLLKPTWSDELVDLLTRVARWRVQARFGADYGQVVMALHESGGSLSISALIRELGYYGLDPRTVEALVSDLRRMRMIRFENGNVVLTQNPFRGGRDGP